MKPTYIVVNGINTNADSVQGWTDLFEDLYQNEGISCNKYEYTCGLIKSLRQSKRVEDISVICKRINKPLAYVGHSNGCEIFGLLLKRHDIKFEVAHLFAPAMDADFNLNGLTYGILSERVKSVYLYCSKNDKALRDWASKTTWMKIFGMGYGTLGYVGPKNVLKMVEDRVDVTWKKFDHSDWFKPKNIEESFKLTLRK